MRMPNSRARIKNVPKLTIQLAVSRFPWFNRKTKPKPKLATDWLYSGPLNCYQFAFGVTKPYNNTWAIPMTKWNKPLQLVRLKIYEQFADLPGSQTSQISCNYFNGKKSNKFCHSCNNVTHCGCHASSVSTSFSYSWWTFLEIVWVLFFFGFQFEFCTAVVL